MTAQFSIAFKQLLGNEGGYVNNPNDPGGATMWGITQRVARANGYTSAMQDLAMTTAFYIAQKEYWNPHNLGVLSQALAFEVLDGVYNGGPAIQWLQKAVGVAETGVIDANTLAKIESVGEAAVIAKYNAYRLLYLCDLAVWPTFGKGWARRIANNILYGETLS